MHRYVGRSPLKGPRYLHFAQSHAILLTSPLNRNHGITFVAFDTPPNGPFKMGGFYCMLNSRAVRRPHRLSVATRTLVVAVVSSMGRLPKAAELRAITRAENSNPCEGEHPPTS